MDIALDPRMYFFYFLKISFIFITKSDIQRGAETEKIFRPMIHSPSDHNGQCCANPQPGASSGSPTRVQGPKALGCLPLLSQAPSRELGEAGVPGLEPAPIRDPSAFKVRS